MVKIITVDLPQDLPESWQSLDYVSPGGVEVGLTDKHGYNYLMKQVNNSQKAAKQIEEFLNYSHRNLLHNWFFANPVNRRQGYLCLKGTSYYTTQDLTTVAGTTTLDKVATYVNNQYCTITVSSTTYYVPTSSVVRGYMAKSNVSIDRWKLDGASAVLRLDSDGIILSFGAERCEFVQNIPINSVSPYLGKTFTLSMEVLSVSSGHPCLYIQTNSGNHQIEFTTAGIQKRTFTMPSNATLFRVGIVNQDTAPCVLKLARVKLELGSYSTLESEPPADYAEEMAKCVQFDLSSGSYRGFTAASTVVADAVVTE